MTNFPHLFFCCCCRQCLLTLLCCCDTCQKRGDRGQILFFPSTQLVSIVASGLCSCCSHCRTNQSFLLSFLKSHCPYWNHHACFKDSDGFWICFSSNCVRLWVVTFRKKSGMYYCLGWVVSPEHFLELSVPSYKNELHLSLVVD